jgi:hypothetical protein
VYLVLRQKSAPGIDRVEVSVRVIARLVHLSNRRTRAAISLLARNGLIEVSPTTGTNRGHSYEVFPRVVNVPVPGPGAPPAVEETPPSPTAEATLRPDRHSADFRSVHWFGTLYTFTSSQAAVIQKLWAAREHGTPDLGQAYLVENLVEEEEDGDPTTQRLADPTTQRLADLFKRHPAWQTMIQSVSKGAYRLQEPDLIQESPGTPID